MTIKKNQLLKTSKRLSQIFIAFFLLSVLGSCEEEVKTILTQDEKDEIILNTYFEENDIQNVQKSTLGVYYIVLEEGLGESVPSNSVVTSEFKTSIIYEKVVESSAFIGQRIFQTASGLIATGVDENDEYEYGTRRVMSAEAEAAITMEVGEKRRLFIPSRLGYPSGIGTNNSTSDVRIPANTVTIMDFEVIKFEN